jgi:sugar fermentation stimulation protein A
MTRSRRARPVSIPLHGPLVETCFVERPNRFLLRCAPPPATSLRADAVLEAHASYAGDDVVYEAHMADPGRLRELLLPGRRVWLRPAVPSPTRRTRWTAVLVESANGSGLVSVDTTLPNRLIHEALKVQALDEFADWELERREVTIGGSRIDFMLRRGDERLVLEVKSVTLVEDGVALFPDAVTARGARHVRELTRVAGEDGWSAAILFVLQRPDAQRIEAAAGIDPVFAAALADAKRAGVRVLGRRCTVTLERLALGGRVPAG